MRALTRFRVQTKYKHSNCVSTFARYLCLRTLYAYPAGCLPPRYLLHNPRSLNVKPYAKHASVLCVIYPNVSTDVVVLLRRSATLGCAARRCKSVRQSLTARTKGQSCDEPIEHVGWRNINHTGTGDSIGDEAEEGAGGGEGGPGHHRCDEGPVLVRVFEKPGISRKAQPAAQKH